MNSQAQAASATLAPQAPPQTAPQQSVRVLFGALMLVMLLASLDQTIVSTALPTIVGELGGLEHLSWIVTAYMLATTVVTPLYGKLGDLFGRKLVLQSAILLFLLGSALCGLAHSMLELILFRALQGLGGGGLMVTTTAAVGDVIPPRDRGRYQGIFGGVFGLSTILGPLIGGFFVEHLSWRWIFYINLPLGLLAVAVIGWAFTPHPASGRRKIDVAGTAFMGVSLTALVLFTSLGGHTLPWGSPEIIGLIVLAVIALAAFALVERRAPEPILPLTLFRNRTFVVASAVGFIVGLAMFGSITFMPLYLQVVKSVSPSEAGLQLTPMMAGMLVTSIGTGQLISRSGRYRIFPIAGTAVMTVGLALLATLGTRSSSFTASAFMLILGLGMGMVMQVLVLAVQNAVDYKVLGVATSGTSLFRSIGGSLGVSLFGAIFQAGLSSHLAGHGPLAGASAATTPASMAAMPPALRHAYAEAFTAALHPVFLWAAIIAAVGFLLTWLLKEQPLRTSARAETIGESFAMPRDATSLEELEFIVGQLSRQERRWPVIERIAKRLEIPLSPDAIWLLVELCRRPEPSSVRMLCKSAPDRTDKLPLLAETLEKRGLIECNREGLLAPTQKGRDAMERIIARYRHHLGEFVERWSPEERAEVRDMLNGLVRQLMAGPPPTPPLTAAA